MTVTAESRVPYKEDQVTIPGILASRNKHSHLPSIDSTKVPRQSNGGNNSLSLNGTEITRCSHTKE